MKPSIKSRDFSSKVEAVVIMGCKMDNNLQVFFIVVFVFLLFLYCLFLFIASYCSAAYTAAYWTLNCNASIHLKSDLLKG